MNKAEHTVVRPLDIKQHLHGLLPALPLAAAVTFNCGTDVAIR